MRKGFFLTQLTSASFSSADGLGCFCGGITPAAHVLDHLLPEVGVRQQFGIARKLVERHPPLLGPFSVTFVAILAQDGLDPSQRITMRGPSAEQQHDKNDR